MSHIQIIHPRGVLPSGSFHALGFFSLPGRLLKARLYKVQGLKRKSVAKVAMTDHSQQWSVVFTPKEKKGWPAEVWMVLTFRLLNGDLLHSQPMRLTAEGGKTAPASRGDATIITYPTLTSPQISASNPISVGTTTQAKPKLDHAFLQPIGGGLGKPYTVELAPDYNWKIRWYELVQGEELEMEVQHKMHTADSRASVLIVA